MPLLETKGAASAQGFGLTLGGAERVFIEDVFSTFLYTGNGSTQTITNGIDLSTKGGLVWLTSRNPLASSYSHQLFDTARGTPAGALRSNETSAQNNQNNHVSSFGSSGFDLGNGNGSGIFANYPTSPNNNYVSWTFRKQPKFFDVVTYTGDGNSSKTISHSLGSVPGCMIVKCSSSTGAWFVYHASLGNTQDIFLDKTDAARTGVVTWNSTTPTATQFQVTSAAGLNTNGVTYVAYLFAHDAGGFGLSGTDNVISCGSYTGNGSTTGPTVPLGYEPQWLLIKKATASGSDRNWWLADSMRGMPVGTGDNFLFPNSSGAESAGWDFVSPSATGFQITTTDDNFNTSGITYIYIAIRRGPMRVPTSGTQVYQGLTYTGNGSAGRVLSGLAIIPDLAIATSRSNTSPKNWCDRLRGENPLISTATDGENGTAMEGKTQIAGSANGTVVLGAYWGLDSVNTNTYTYINNFLSRAPGFFDVVCHTGDGTTNRLLNHNLTVQPELIITKARSTSSYDWIVTYLPYPNSLRLNLTNAVGTYANGGAPTATQFYVSGASQNNNTDTYVNYLFASCPGVSKVGSYTGTGNTLQINCGFTGGARFVLIKRTDSTGDWYVWDTARGIVAGNDPYLALNSTAAEVTTTDWVDTFSSGFELSNVGGNNVNINTATYIYLAIA